MLLLSPHEFPVVVLDPEFPFLTKWPNPVAPDQEHPWEAIFEKLASRNKFPWETLRVVYISRTELIRSLGSC